MELFDKRFVHFMWDDELKGKRGFLSSGIDTLIKMVNDDFDRAEIQKGCEKDLPFCKHITVECRLAYYDPNYEAKKAHNEGKEIQFKDDVTGEWCLAYNPRWALNIEYRVKPEEKQYRPYESSAEMIFDFIDRFKFNCLSYCKPLIWVRLKGDKRERLIVAYGDNFVEIGNKAKAVTLQHLFKQYEFLNGSPVGMEVKE